jgi:hypothetical protein|tara:strand:- start:2123 stop:2320 length:198 start_codon:yes stop_codon:yes gene_type:complete
MEVLMAKTDELLARLEKHEGECALRYKSIDERLENQDKVLKGLDMKLWGLAGLILAASLGGFFAS